MLPCYYRNNNVSVEHSDKRCLSYWMKTNTSLKNLSQIREAGVSAITNFLYS